MASKSIIFIACIIAAIVISHQVEETSAGFFDGIASIFSGVLNAIRAGFGLPPPFKRPPVAQLVKDILDQTAATTAATTSCC
jgi:hypothetical protein